MTGGRPSALAGGDDHDLVADEVIKVGALALVSRDNNGKVQVEDITNEPGSGAVVGAVGGALVGLIFPPNPPGTLAVLAQVGRIDPDMLCIQQRRAVRGDLPRLPSPWGRRCSPPKTESEDALSAAIPNGH